MNIDLNITGAEATAPDYQTLRALLAIHVKIGAMPAGSAEPACSFSRAGVARVFGLGEQGKDVLNLRGSTFGETGGVAGLPKPERGADGSNQSVQGAYA